MSAAYTFISDFDLAITSQMSQIQKQYRCQKMEIPFLPYYVIIANSIDDARPRMGIALDIAKYFARCPRLAVAKLYFCTKKYAKSKVARMGEMPKIFL